ncbi:hypothetical protein D623_10014610 [Myotis brandtii]|uniref:Uncharacterized protein n=1 Tax=Myotis brandtii TaxID=109478 RepID=S7MIL5_MYOBR|nr:hypothetical protein D623_10014610 [Myotis brandtii]
MGVRSGKCPDFLRRGGRRPHTEAEPGSTVRASAPEIAAHLSVISPKCRVGRALARKMRHNRRYSLDIGRRDGN